MSFSIEKASEKLSSLENTQQSIQSTSQWCLFHHRHAPDIVSLWDSLFHSDNNLKISTDISNFRLILFYLANDIIQFSKKKKEPKYASFVVEFHKKFPGICKFLAANDFSNNNLKQKYLRVLDVWIDRSIYPTNYINSLKKDLNSSGNNGNTIMQNNNNNNNNNNNTPFIPLSHPINNLNTIPSNVSSINNNSLNVPTELLPIVNNYNRLDPLYKIYKSNFLKFNKLLSNMDHHHNNISSNATKNNSGDNGKKDNDNIQLNNLLSSLSSLQGLTSNPNKPNKKNQPLDHEDYIEDMDEDITLKEIEKLNDLQKLGSEIEKQSKDIRKIRLEISSNLKNLSKELDDWIELDNTKFKKLNTSINDINERKKSLESEREKEATFSYGDANNGNSTNNNNNDSNSNNLENVGGDDGNGSSGLNNDRGYGGYDENIPRYDETADDSDSDSDNIRRKNNSDSDDSDADEAEAEAANYEDTNKGLNKKRSLPDEVSNSVLKKIKQEEPKNKNKSVSFAEDTTTVVFDENQSANVVSSEEPAKEDPEDNQHATDLEKLLGQLSK